MEDADRDRSLLMRHLRAGAELARLPGRVRWMVPFGSDARFAPQFRRGCGRLCRRVCVEP